MFKYKTTHMHSIIQCKTLIVLLLWKLFHHAFKIFNESDCDWLLICWLWLLVCIPGRWSDGCKGLCWPNPEHYPASPSPLLPSACSNLSTFVNDNTAHVFLPALVVLKHVRCPLQVLRVCLCLFMFIWTAHQCYQNIFD